MPIIAKLNYLRIAPRKVRLVADLIRGKSVKQARMILNFATKKSAQSLLKLLNSAVANAKNNFQLEDAELLYISKITVNEGQKLKRWRPRARGQAYQIQKKTSLITMALEEITKTAKKYKKGKKQRIVQKAEEVKKQEKEPKIVKKIAKAKFKDERKILKPRIERGTKRIFKRKSF